MGSSRAISTAITLITIIIIISNLLLSPPTTVTSFSLWPYHHVHVSSELTGGKMLLVHYKSGTRNFGVRNISPGNEFTWRFRPFYLFASTLFWCYIAPDDSHHIYFDAWRSDIANKYEYGRSMSWVAKDDGLYVRIPNKVDQCWRKWDHGRMAQMT